MTWTSVVLIASNLASSLLLSSNNRISSFYWISRSNHYFLTHFFYFSPYFFILVFLLDCYLLVSLRLSRLHGNPTSCPVFSYPWESEVLRCMCAPKIFWHTSHVSSKQDACRNLVLESVLVFFPRSAFCQRFLMQTSVGQLRIIPFLLT
jgi:hypothetical protein